MAKRQPLSDFAKAQIQARQQRYADIANRVAQEREARTAMRAIDQQYGLEGITSRERQRAIAMGGDLEGSFRTSAVQSALANRELGLAENMPSRAAIDSVVDRRLNQVSNSQIPAEALAAYQQLGGNIAQASQMNVPVSLLEQRRAQILQQQNQAAAALAPRLAAEGDLARGLGQGALATAQAADIPATLPARTGVMESDAARQQAQAALAQQQATSLGQMTGAQMQAIQQGGGRVLPPDVQYIAPAVPPTPTPVQQSEIDLNQAKIREIESKMRADPNFAQRVQAAMAVAQNPLADEQSKAQAQQFIQSLFTQGSSGGLSGQSSTGVPWQLNQ